MSVFRLRLRTLSPVFIGDGQELRKGFEYEVHQGKTYRLNVDAILEAKPAAMHPDAQGRYPTPGSLLNPSDFEQNEYFRYVLPGMPRSGKTFAEVKSFIKDVYDVPYIPGSSLKGAIRTALAWHGWSEVNIKLDRNQIGRSRSWAGQPLERRIFGRDPNHDLLRALHVSDLFGVAKPGEGLRLVNAQVLTKREHGSPVELEALVGDHVFSGTLKIDDTLFQPWAEQLHFSNRRRWLEELCARVQAHSRARIQELIVWFENAEDGSGIAQFYRQLFNARIEKNQALVQIGWGSGWEGKTFWTHLKKDVYLFEKIISDFKLQRRSKGAPPRKPGDPFPSSRRVAMGGKQGVFAPVAPFGWVLIELENM